MIRVKEKGIRIRSTPEIRDDNKIGSIDLTGSDFCVTYFVYETAGNDGYTWYRIGKKRRVASDGNRISEFTYD